MKDTLTEVRNAINCPKENTGDVSSFLDSLEILLFQYRRRKHIFHIIFPEFRSSFFKNLSLYSFDLFFSTDLWLINFSHWVAPNWIKLRNLNSVIYLHPLLIFMASSECDKCAFHPIQSNAISVSMDVLQTNMHRNLKIMR